MPETSADSINEDVNPFDDPLFLNNSDYSGMEVIGTKFNGENYISWCGAVNLALGSKNKLGFLDGSTAMPAITSSTYKKWLRSDYMVRCWLINSIDQHLKETFLYCNSAMQLWSQLQERYQNTPFQPLPFGDFSYGGTSSTFSYGYGSSTGMTPVPPLRLSEADLGRQIVQEREEKAKKLDDKVRDELEERRKGDLRLAELAIKFYNDEHGTSYEVVATLGSCHHLHFGHWYHCNFRAHDTNRRSSQPKLFFSELFCPGADMISAKVCTMLDGPGQRPHTVRGCKVCGDELLHPVNGFERGN